MLLVASFTVYAQLKKYDYIFGFIFFYFWALLISTFVAAIVHIKDINTTFIFWLNAYVPTFVASSILLVMSTISYYYPSKLSIDEVSITFMISYSVAPVIDLLIVVVASIVFVISKIKSYYSHNKLLETVTTKKKHLL